MSERNEKRLFNVIFAVLAVVIIAFAVDIEMKLSRLMSSEAMVVNTYPDTTESTSVDVYSFHNELTANNSTSSQPLSSAEAAVIGTTESTTVITEASSESYVQSTTAQSEVQYVQPTVITSANVTEPITTTVSSTIWSVDADQNFYRTKSGTKYHKADCPYLKNSRILVTVDEIANEGYEPCLKCMKGE